jgi:hypothetical protein
MTEDSHNGGVGTAEMPWRVKFGEQVRRESAVQELLVGLAGLRYVSEETSGGAGDAMLDAARAALGKHSEGVVGGVEV